MVHHWSGDDSAMSEHISGPAVAVQKVGKFLYALFSDSGSFLKNELTETGKNDIMIAGSPDRRIAGSPDRRIAGSPDRRIAGSPPLRLQHGTALAR